MQPLRKLKRRRIRKLYLIKKSSVVARFGPFNDSGPSQ